jgi:hypothetical protein
MSNLNEILSPYEQIYADVEKIFESRPVYILGAYAGRTSPATDEKLAELAEYAKKFDGEENNGKLRTILVILKPYKNNPIIKETADLLADQLRSRSKTGFI